MQVQSENLDQHSDHYPKQTELFTILDHGMSALVSDLADRGMLDHTIVIAVGKFGRTPKMNKRKGRDHWIDGFSVALAGGGFKRGFVYGATTDDGQEIRDHVVTIPDFFATLCHDLGINPEKEYVGQFDRPIKLVDKGEVVRDILAKGGHAG